MRPLFFFASITKNICSFVRATHHLHHVIQSLIPLLQCKKIDKPGQCQQTTLLIFTSYPVCFLRRLPGRAPCPGFRRFRGLGGPGSADEGAPCDVSGTCSSGTGSEGILCDSGDSGDSGGSV